jgi:leader peptidase (prepilin peptidase)/N-methyltransferase
MFWQIYLGAVIFLLGIMMGSFFNVCIYRIPLSMSVIRPSSHCESCSHALAPLDLIPIFSWVLLGRKCRYCKAPISIRYPMVEFLTGLLFLLLYLKFQLSFSFFIYLFFVSILVIIAFIDIDHRIIPDRFVIMGLVVGFIALIGPVLSVIIDRMMLPDAGGGEVFTQAMAAFAWKDALFGALIGGGSLLLMDISGRIFFKKEGMGFGDVKLMTMAGILLGFQKTAVSLLIAVWIAAVAGIIVLRTRKDPADHYIPFGPFLAAGCVFSIFFGKELLRWYISLL